MNELPLDDRTLRFLEQRIAQMKAIESELNGALSLLIEQHELQGRWQLDLPNRRLIRSEARNASPDPSSPGQGNPPEQQLKAA